MDIKLTIRDWHWEITKRCNLKCLHCLIGDRSGYELTTTEALNAISSIVKLGGKKLLITGGEPLVRNDLYLIIKEAYLSGLNLGLITNGTMIDAFFLKEAGKYIQNMAVSIDGPKQIHDRIRGKGVYDKSIAAIRQIMDYGIDVSVYAIIHSLNENLIDVFVEDLVLIGVKSFHFNEINPEGRSLENKSLLLDLKKTDDRTSSILFQLQKIVKIERFEINSGCSISPSSVYLQSDGSVYACVELAFNLPSQKISHIFDENIEKKVNSFFSKALHHRDDKCRYISFNSPGISINLNELRECPVIRRIDNEPMST